MAKLYSLSLGAGTCSTFNLKCYAGRAVAFIKLIFPDSERVGAQNRDSVGGCTVIGDHRWTGAFGVNVDLIARSHCSVELIKTEDIVVSFGVFRPLLLAVFGFALSEFLRNRKLWRNSSFSLSNVAYSEQKIFIKKIEPILRMLTSPHQSH